MSFECPAQSEDHTLTVSTLRSRGLGFRKSVEWRVEWRHLLPFAF